MLRISPTAAARLSPTIGRDRPSRQRESAPRFWGGASTRIVSTTSIHAIGACNRPPPRPGAMTGGHAVHERLKRYEDSLFILNLSTELTFGLGIAHPDHLPRSAVFEHFDFER